MIVERRHHLQAAHLWSERRPAGLGTAVVSAAAFGTSGTFATSLLRSGWTPGAAVTVRLLIAALALTIPAVRQLRRRPGTVRAGWRTMVVYGVVPIATCQLCYFEAVQHLSVAVALLLEYSGILLVVAWMWSRHHQVPTRTTLAGSVAAIAGLVLVLNLVGDHHLAFAGLLWGAGSAVGLAVYFVLSARDDENGMPPLVVAWGGMWSGALTMAVLGGVGVLPFEAPRRAVVLAGSRVSWVVCVLGLGVLAGAFAYVSGIAAARTLGARVASFVGLAEVLFAALYAWLLLGQQLSALQLAGAALVVGGIVLVRLGEVAVEVEVEAEGNGEGDVELGASGAAVQPLPGGSEALSAA